MYATKTDLENRLGADVLIMLADDNNDGEADDAAILAALEQATAFMNASLGARYALPIKTPSPALVWVCVSLAVPLLYSHRREPLPDSHKAQGEAALDFLNSIRRGEIILHGASPRSLAESTTRACDKIFGSKRTADF
jgi:phage gp36-like protein